MKLITIKRTHHRIDGTFGVIDDDGEPFALTVERPWLDNEVGVSCIPGGSYKCQRIVSPHFGDVFQIMDVPQRTNVLIHYGNFMTDSEGCIIVGENFCQMKNKTGETVTAVGGSRTVPGEGFLELMDRVKGLNEFELLIF